MNRGVLTIILVVLVLAIIGVGMALFWQPSSNNGNATTNESANGNTNSSIDTNTITNGDFGNTNISYRSQQLDEKQVDQRVSYRGADVAVDRIVLKDGVDFNGPASGGKKIAYVYLEREKLEHAEHMQLWIEEVNIRDGEGRVFPVDRASFPAASRLETDEPYLQFSIEQDSKDLKLTFIRSGEDVQMELGI